MPDRGWLSNAVVHQIHPRSSADGNGDGIGDLAGIRQRLPYPAGLGAEAVWLSPWYASPMADGGYDIADRHPWFRRALAAGPGSRERARFHFRPGRGPDGALPPTGWSSHFGGPAWTRVPDGEWYLHLFAPEQPDFPPRRRRPLGRPGRRARDVPLLAGRSPRTERCRERPPCGSA
ncbi:alpha-amylase family glycosyl hydrolase, partial [Streptomyces xanthophaeus]